VVDDADHADALAECLQHHRRLRGLVEGLDRHPADAAGEEGVDLVDVLLAGSPAALAVR
jgi:hypothetical protein